jgi:hypothetical protein
MMRVIRKKPGTKRGNGEIAKVLLKTCNDERPTTKDHENRNDDTRMVNNNENKSQQASLRSLKLNGISRVADGKNKLTL